MIQMRRIGLYIGIGFLTFVFGILVNSLALKFFRENFATVLLESDATPQFVAVSSLLDHDYHIYWYKTPDSDDDQEITLYADFRSREVTLEHFESNADPDGATIIEIGSKFDENGHTIGRRGIAIFNDVKAARIFWTDGDNFWSVQAPSLELARQFEESAIVHAITRSTKLLERNSPVSRLRCQ